MTNTWGQPDSTATLVWRTTVGLFVSAKKLIQYRKHKRPAGFKMQSV